MKKRPFYPDTPGSVSDDGEERPREALANGPVDPETVEKARRGDPAAMDALIRGVAPGVHRLALRLTADHNAAEDLTMEALYRGSVKIGKLRDPRAAAAWFRSTLLNLWRDRMRRARPGELSLGDAPEPAEPPGDGPAALLDAEELREACAKALPLLPPAQRAVLALVIDEGLTVTEVAAALGTTADRVKANLWHGRRRLRELLARFAGEEPRP
jgi:RNA polymerase sigma-70 factor (ECF subfamily)